MSPKIKAIIFDVGGVCVLSPMLAIAKYERTHCLPSGYINYAIAGTAPSGAWHKLERGEIPMDTAFFNSFTSDLSNYKLWTSFHIAQSLPAPAQIPEINGEELFCNMMAKSRTFDPYVLPAIHALRKNGGYKLAALTNDYAYPPDHPYSDNSRLKELFDVFVSSSSEGMRKPEERFYRLALQRLGVSAKEVVFLDDIGANLKPAKEIGMRTIKVGLGESWKAVRELEEIIKVKLLPQSPEGTPPRLEKLKVEVVGRSKL
ncbi:Bifunctional epoxide hydrolase 2 [Rhizina undulata]